MQSVSRSCRSVLSVGRRSCIYQRRSASRSYSYPLATIAAVTRCSPSPSSRSPRIPFVWSHLFTTSTMSDAKPEPKKVKIYTKTGDSGTSSLFTGERRKKSDPVFEALGTTDELNANIGVAYEYCMVAGHDQIAEYLTEIQSRLLDIGGHVATPRTNADSARIGRTEFPEAHVATLEQWIDTMDESLPPLRNFILPSGGLSSAHLHVARAVCRRAERLLVEMTTEQHDVAPQVLKYVNRLSDFLFTAARYAALAEGKPETIYKRQREAVTPPLAQ